MFVPSLLQSLVFVCFGRDMTRVVGSLHWLASFQCDHASALIVHFCCWEPGVLLRSRRDYLGRREYQGLIFAIWPAPAARITYNGLGWPAGLRSKVTRMYKFGSGHSIVCPEYRHLTRFTAAVRPRAWSYPCSRSAPCFRQARSSHRSPFPCDQATCAASSRSGSPTPSQSRLHHPLPRVYPHYPSML